MGDKELTIVDKNKILQNNRIKQKQDHRDYLGATAYESLVNALNTEYDNTSWFRFLKKKRIKRALLIVEKYKNDAFYLKQDVLMGKQETPQEFINTISNYKGYIE